MRLATEDLPAAEIVAAVKAGKASAREVAQATLARIEAHNGALGAFTDVTATRALAKADAIDAAGAKGEALGPLAGAPFAVKNLFDIAGLPTRAGSKINRDLPPAAADATLTQRLQAAGAILVGALNMGEYAYDFTGENIHDGPSRNPHDPSHMSGGSSGGSGTAVAGGLVPLALGSDTNGSIRVPSSLCGVFGLKPTYGRLSRTRTFPFVASFDHLGPMARSVADLALAYDAMLGADADDPAHANVAAHPVMPGAATRRSAVCASPRSAAISARLASPPPSKRSPVSPGRSAPNAPSNCRRPSARAPPAISSPWPRARRSISTACARAGDFDPDVRDRLIAGAMLPGAWIVKAQKFRSWFRAQAAALFGEVDVLLAPATPCRAPRLGQKTMVLGGEEMLVRPNLGLFTQPISFIGLPVATVPVWTEGEKLPIGVQIIAAPWREDLVLRVARALEERGIVSAPIAKAG